MAVANEVPGAVYARQMKRVHDAAARLVTRSGPVDQLQLAVLLHRPCQPAKLVGIAGAGSGTPNGVGLPQVVKVDGDRVVQAGGQLGEGVRKLPGERSVSVGL